MRRPHWRPNLLPLPKNAVITDFTLNINGKALKGELCEKAAAREGYMKLVGRTATPACWNT